MLHFDAYVRYTLVALDQLLDRLLLVNRQQTRKGIAGSNGTKEAFQDNASTVNGRGGVRTDPKQLSGNIGALADLDGAEVLLRILVAVFLKVANNDTSLPLNGSQNMRTCDDGDIGVVMKIGTASALSKMLLKAVKAATKVAMMQQHQNTEGLQGQQSAAAETCTWMVPKKTPLALLEAAIALAHTCAEAGASLR